ncbi:uncharacterized protein LOC110111310 isoform X1 [Dendrobium catenatum]|uniref:uncharacterized protein LOC110111310 isoform X1 n=2 Tax=Dendrobium catenatum TaxID=906689 RepID=UPI0010A05B0F|nr:uncharacterized protein LOC110111310 isoform X1 [Dendrobium catenatum]
MALSSSCAGSSNPRQPKAFAVRSFPSLCDPVATAEEQPAADGNLISGQKAPPSPLITPPEPTSCGPGSDFISYRGKIFKTPIVFATRKFPKGCGPVAASIPKPSDEASTDIAKRIPEEGSDEKDAENSTRKSSQIPDFVEGAARFLRPEGYEAKVKVEEVKEKLKDIVRRIPEKSIGLGKFSENTLVGKSLGGKDGEKHDKKSSLMPDFVKDGKRVSRPEGLVVMNKIGKTEEELNDVVRRTSKEGSGLGKVLKNDVLRKSLGGKDGEKPNEKRSLMPHFVKDGRRFYRPERSEHMKKVEGTKEKLNNVVRKISKEGNGFGKILGSDIVGRSSCEKDGKKPNGKRSLMPVESGRSEGSQLLEVRGERLIVQALMAAKRCPWMQGKGRGSIGLQSGQKKPRIRASGNSKKTFGPSLILGSSPMIRSVWVTSIAAASTCSCATSTPVLY